MQTISVPLQNRSYPIWIENGLINTLPELFKPLNQGQRWVLFSQAEIFIHYGATLVNSLKNDGFSVESIIYPDGEEAKSLTALEGIYSQLIEMGCDRSSTFLALGGGVVGDITGYIAATFMRGVDYIQIPTTLLAMVDSSIGGKTGVNLPEGKNLVGAIWQPKAVVIDPELLHSLPKREVTSAFGEVIKYGAILDRELFDLISENLDDLINLKNPTLIMEVISRCAKLKADIVAEDEREGDNRRILNFGHTIGHALETHFGFDTLRHGEAIAYGMLVAGKLSISGNMGLVGPVVLCEPIIIDGVSDVVAATDVTSSSVVGGAVTRCENLELKLTAPVPASVEQSLPGNGELAGIQFRVKVGIAETVGGLAAPPRNPGCAQVLIDRVRVFCRIKVHVDASRVGLVAGHDDLPAH